MASAIEIHNLTKVFDTQRAKSGSLKTAILSLRRVPSQKMAVLKNIDLSIGHGETVAVIGRNGSGKSTLLGVIGRIYKPTTGTVKVDGRMSTLMDPGAGFHPELTGRENIFFNAAIMGLTTAQIRDKLTGIIEFSEIEEYIDAPVKTYSAGMLMRLGFSIAVEIDPDILLIDEALSVGDAAFQEKCYQRINEFKAAGKTIVFVTHDLESAKLVASRTIWLHQGEIMADGDTRSAVDSYLTALPKHAS